MNRRFPDLRPFAFAAALAVTFATISFAGPAGAQGGGCSGLDRAGTECKLTDVVNPPRAEPGGKPVLRPKSVPPGPYFEWREWNNTPCDAANSGGWIPTTDVAAAIGDLILLAAAGEPDEPGTIWIGWLTLPSGERLNTGFITCVGVGSGLPARPPQLPTAGEIWGEALTFEPEVHLDPYVRGLTGLETYMWYPEDLVTDTVTITLNGYEVTAQLDAVWFIWDTGGESRTGIQEYDSPVHGSAEDPAVIHTYALPGEVVVYQDTVWTGTSVVTGPGLPVAGVVVDLGEVVLQTARDYDVIEIRTPLVRG